MLPLLTFNREMPTGQFHRLKVMMKMIKKNEWLRKVELLFYWNKEINEAYRNVETMLLINEFALSFLSF